MAYEFICVCETLLTVDEQFIGCPVECPECGETVIVPEYDDEESAFNTYGDGFEPADLSITCPQCDSSEVFAEKQSLGRKCARHFGGAIAGGIVASVFGFPAKIGSDAGSMMAESRAYTCSDCGHTWKLIV